MKKFKKIYLVFIIFLCFSPSFTNERFSQKSPDENYREGWNVPKLDTARNVEYLTTVEKDVILEHNMVRTNPKKYAEMYVKPIIESFEGENLFKISDESLMVTYESISAYKECYNVLCKAKPCDILYPSKGLSKAAKWHAETQGKKGESGHTGIDGSSLDDRCSRYGSWEITLGECIDYGYNNGRNIVLHLIIDDGISNRGHRKNILNKDFKFVGIGFASHSEWDYECVIDYAGKYEGLK